MSKPEPCGERRLVICGLGTRGLLLWLWLSDLAGTTDHQSPASITVNCDIGHTHDERPPGRPECE